VAVTANLNPAWRCLGEFVDINYRTDVVYLLH